MTTPIYTPKYSSNEEVIQLLGLASDDSSINATMLSKWICDMEEYVERITHRVFIADTTASVRYYDSPETNETFDGHSQRNWFHIDECVEIGNITIDGISLVADTDYVVEPYNEVPYYKITLLRNFSGFGFEKKKNIEVTAKWGYSVACPPAISFAVAVLACGIVSSFKTVVNSVRQERIGDYMVTYEPDLSVGFDSAISTIKEYKKYYV